jgi:ribosomal protein S18 acetylase RimI-like enzyme
MKNYERRDFEPLKVTEILEFAKANPWKPFWTEELMHRFLTVLCSSPIQVFDFHENNRRVATGVLLDNIQNKGNNAALEILGIDSTVDSEFLIEKMLKMSKVVLLKQFDGVEITFHHKLKYVSELAKRQDLHPYYQSFEMLHPSVSEVADVPGDDISTATRNDDRELYQVLLRSFEDNIDTSIPRFEDWLEGREQSDSRQTFLTKKSGQITGFLNLVGVTHPVPEIRTIGVLPEHRGQGLGARLINHALGYLKQRGSKVCALTVTVQNERALNLYRKQGFREVDRLEVYRWSRPK